MRQSRAMTATDAEPGVGASTRRTGRKSDAASLFIQPLTPILTVLGVTLLVVVAVSTARTAGMIAALWAANGLAAAVWLRSGRGHSYDLCFGGLIAFGILAGEFLVGNEPVIAVGMTVINMVEIIIAVAMTRRFAPMLNLATVSGASRFILCIAAIPPGIAGVMAGGLLMATSGSPFLPTFQTWWFGHALGLAVIGSFVGALSSQAVRRLFQGWRAVETLVIFALLIAVCAVIYFVSELPVSFILVPILILIAIRMRVLGVAAALVVISIISVGSLISNAPAWREVTGNLAERAVLLQLTILLGYLPMLLVAALLEERDRLSARAKTAQLRAERASAAKSRLLANVAHEIKSPIGGIIGIGDLWSTGQLGPVSETQAEMATMLVKTARQVEALSHDLLDVARAESGAMKVEVRPTNVFGILEDVRRATAMRPEARLIAIKTICEGDDLVALADSQRLAQVIDNLATNAVKYGASGGEIVFHAHKVDDRIRIEVIDQGPGLTLEKQAQLFEPFNRLGLERSTVEGHGIGLALAKRLVELQGGTIGVTSTPGEGSTFWLELQAA